MAFMGEPDLELQELLAEIDEVQHAARKPICVGVTGGDIYAAAEKVLARTANGAHMHFCAHGVGARLARGAAAHQQRPGAL
jgi:Xaa-Pro dipeptidase